MKWDKEVDVLVFGAGAGGMTAALVSAHEGMDVMLCEKTEQVGGTTATSGGTIWVPGTTHSKKLANPDNIADARRYVDDEAGAEGHELREAFYAAGADALDYLGSHTDVKFKVNDPYPDYHPENPGGAQGGRALGPLPFDGRLLGNDFASVRPPMPEFMVLHGMMVGRDEIKHLIRPWKSLAALRMSCRLLWRHLGDRIGHARGTRLLLGNALVGRMLFSLRKTKVNISLRARLVELVRNGTRVDGAIIEIGAGRVAVRARRAVILATGGCAASERWRNELMGDVKVPHALAFAGDSGDGLDAAKAVGGDIDRNHVTPFFWMPASVMHWSDGRDATYPHIRDRPKPGLIAVNSAGSRFVNEGASYHDFVMAMLRTHRSVPSIPAYLVCDRAFIHDYGLGVIHPVWQWLRYFVERGYLETAPTLAGLAAKIGIDPGGLERSVVEHNKDAATGVDQSFGKGSSAFARFNGDAANKPNPCLRPIVKPPFYALAVYPAPIGSSVGLRTNGDGQVLDATRSVIEGLYAVGNDMSSVMRGSYPGPGITLGPAIVFAYRAAMHVAHGVIAERKQAALAG